MMGDLLARIEGFRNREQPMKHGMGVENHLLADGPTCRAGHYRPQSDRMSLAPAIHTIDLRFQNTPEIVAAFLIEGPEGLILIETGPGSTLPRLLEGIAELGFRPAEVRDVFVTHIHLDHAGAAGWWARENGSTIYAHPQAERHLVDPAKLMASARLVYGERMESLWGEMLPAPAGQVVALADGQKVCVGGVEVTALDTPGHARHHHCYAISGAIFTGDVAGMRLPGTDYLSVTSAPPQFDPVAYAASIDRLIAQRPERLMLTHFGEVADDPEDHLRRYGDAVALAAEFVRQRLVEGMDGDSLQIAYQAFQMEQAFKAGLPSGDWHRCQRANPTGMSADGIRLYWEKAGK
jgi:glyoxylase-like metal-dependent hydrolase (beta-lactamase superfamily II)